MIKLYHISRSKSIVEFSCCADSGIMVQYTPSKQEKGLQMTHKLLKPYIKFLSGIKNAFDKETMLVLMVAISTLIKINIVVAIGSLVLLITCSKGWTLLSIVNAIFISFMLYPIEIRAITDMVKRYEEDKI